MRAALAVLCLLAIAAAEEKPVVSKEQKVRRLLELTGKTGLGREMLDKVAEQCAQGGAPPQLAEAFRKADPEILTARLVEIVLKRYEEADLDAVLALYEGPAGKPLLAAQAAAERDTLEAVQEWVQGLATQALAAAQPGNPNEVSAEKAMRTLVDAEANFMKADYDNDGKDFCYSLNVLHYQVDAAGRKLELIPKTLADGLKQGYKFSELATYDTAGGTDCRFGFAYCAVPEDHAKSGGRTLIVNHTGAIFTQDTGGKAPAAWPDTANDTGWVLLGE